MLAILDYSAGNQTSVRRALDNLGVPCVVSANPDVLARSQGIVFPGVGAAGSAMADLRGKGLDRLLASLVQAGKPLLGICVGCQVLLEHCLEHDTPTMGLVPGRCVMFDPAWQDEDGLPIRIPHMGWNRLRTKEECRLLKDIDPEAEFYFVHGYYPVPDPEYVIATTFYGREFCSVHGRTGLWAVQFHPEKSGRPGLTLLKNFYDYCLEVAHAQ